MTTPEVTTIVCTRCTQEKTLDQYHRGSGKHGRASICKECKSAKAREYWQRKKGARRPVTKATLAATVPTPTIPTAAPPLLTDTPEGKAPAPRPVTLVLSFEGHENIREWLDRAAKEGFRDPEQQALYILARAAKEARHEI